MLRFDQQMQAIEKVEVLDMVGKKTQNPIDITVELPLEKSIQTSEENDIGQEITNADQIIKVPCIDFIFEDCSFILEDSTKTLKIQRLMHITVRSYIQVDDAAAKPHRYNQARGTHEILIFNCY